MYNLEKFIVYIPLSALGLWRWSMWLAKKFGASLYRPKHTPWPEDIKRPTVSLVVPVYNEDPQIFEMAIQSWIENGVDEIIAVIDHSNVSHIINYQRVYEKLDNPKCRLIVTRKPGKRPALADGIMKATGDIIALVDSDTIWGNGVWDKVVNYFTPQQIGGVSTQQRVLKPKTIAQILFDIVLWTRYNEEVPFLLATGRVFNTLSGRTAFYRREAIFAKKYDNLHLLTHEYYFKSRCISGDDKRLTHLILEQGWEIAFAKEAIVYTPGASDLKTFFKQRLRWTRNSWRADTRAFKKGWIFRHPALAFFNFDRFVQPFFMLVGPIVFVISLVNKLWLVAGILVAWWLVSRTVRLFGYFKAHPLRLRYLPAYIVFSYYNAVMKIYAWATILEQGWITRWDKKRLSAHRRKSFVFGSLSTASIIVGIIFIVQAIHFNLTHFVQRLAQPSKTLAITTISPANSVNSQPLLPVDARTGQQFQTYAVLEGDSLTAIAEKLGVNLADLKLINGLNNHSVLSIGETIYYRK